MLAISQHKRKRQAACGSGNERIQGVLGAAVGKRLIARIKSSDSPDIGRPVSNGLYLHYLSNSKIFALTVKNKSLELRIYQNL